jgi:hypothetical protein
MIHVGVTGHRFITEIDKVTAGVDAALDMIVAAFEKQPLAVLSSLAEGADRLVAKRFISKYVVRLIVVLPLPESDYISDFDISGSKEEFYSFLANADKIIPPPRVDTREEAYTVAGRYILDHCDVLLAIWDGKEAQGKGGTGELVTEARRRKLPVAWIHAGNRQPGNIEPTSLGLEQGKVTYERFPYDIFFGLIK